jgi:hypothetical protein
VERASTQLLWVTAMLWRRGRGMGQSRARGVRWHAPRGSPALRVFPLLLIPHFHRSRRAAAFVRRGRRRRVRVRRGEAVGS